MTRDGYQYTDIPDLPRDERWALPLAEPDPAKVEGPELGAIMVLPGKSYSYQMVDGEKVWDPPRPDRTVRVTARWYHWSPEVVNRDAEGKPVSRGTLLYDASVIEDVNDPSYHVVVNDSELRPVPPTQAAIEDIIAYEEGELSFQDTVIMFGVLVRNGSAWTLQGSYGRMARALIDMGYLAEDGTVLREQPWE